MIPLASILPSVVSLKIVDEPAPAPSSAKPLEQYAQKLLADSKVAFPFGSSNQGNNRTSLDQFNFILDKLLKLIKNDNLFDEKIKKLKLSKQDQLLLKKERDEVIKELKNIGIKDIQTEEGSVFKEAWGRSCVENKSFNLIFRLMTLYPGNSIKSSYEIEAGENWLENWHQHFLPSFAGFSLKHSRAQLDCLVNQIPDLFEKNKKYSELCKIALIIILMRIQKTASCFIPIWILSMHYPMDRLIVL